MKISFRTISVFVLFLLLLALPAWGQMQINVSVTNDVSGDDSGGSVGVWNDVYTADDSTGCSSHSMYQTEAFMIDEGYYLQPVQNNGNGFSSAVTMPAPALADQPDTYDTYGMLYFYCGCSYRYWSVGNNSYVVLKFANTWTSWSDFTYIPSLEICLPASYSCSSGTPTVKDPSIRCFCAGCSYPTCPDYGWADYQHALIVPSSGKPHELIFCIGVLAEDRPQKCS